MVALFEAVATTVLLLVWNVNAVAFYGYGIPSSFSDVEFKLVNDINTFEPNAFKSAQSFVSQIIGQAVGLATGPKNDLVVFHRADRVWDRFSFDDNNVFNKSLSLIMNATIAVVERETGKLIGEYGQNMFYMPHGLSTDNEGNYWVTDVGRHQVFKLNKDFKPILELGEKLVPGSDSTHFCKPTDVAVSSSGEFFVADGYCNSRIIKFDRNGKFISQFGMPNSVDPPKNGQLFVPHSLALIEDMNLLCVADRENERIQCFTAGLEPYGAHQRAVVRTGTFVTKAQDVGRVMAIRERNHILFGVTNIEMENSNDCSVFVMDINTGRATTLGSGIPDAHAITVNDYGEIFVAQLEPNQVIKLSVATEGDEDEK